MTKLKMLVVALLIGVSGLASAYDIAHGIRVLESGKPVIEMGVTYYGLTKAEFAKLTALDTKFVTATEKVGETAAAKAAKDKNIVANYTVMLTGQVTDDAGSATLLPPVIFDKLTHKDVNKIMRSNQTYISSLVNDSEMQAARGKKPWGNK